MISVKSLRRPRCPRAGIQIRVTFCWSGLQLREETLSALCQETVVGEGASSNIKLTEVPSTGTVMWFHPHMGATFMGTQRGEP